MTCDEGRVLAFLDGEMSETDERAFDRHLLACESCWQAVREDRLGRLALEQLQVPTPPGLADRVRLSIELAPQHPARGGAPRVRHHDALRPAGRLRLGSPRRLATAAALVVAVLAGALGGMLLHHHPASDPPQIADVVAMVTPAAAGNATLRRGEQFRFGGQSLTVRSYEVEGIVTLVATSRHPFPMPASSHLLAGSSPTAWMASRGSLSMYGVNHPAGSDTESMFLVAAMPAGQLPQVAARLHLI